MSYRVDRGRHLAASTFVGWLDVELSLPIFRLALAVFIPWRGADGFDRRAGLLVSNKFDLADEMGNLSWGYWHALCATPHIAPYTSARLSRC